MWRQRIFHRLYEGRNWFEVTFTASDIFECSIEENSGSYIGNFNFNWKIYKNSKLVYHRALSYF
jgi:hypothetical protein